MRCAVLSLLLCAVFSGVVTGAEAFRLPEKLPAHPRLFLTKQRELDLKELAKKDVFLQRQVAAILAQADRLVLLEPSRFEGSAHEWFLDLARCSFKKTATCGFAYRWTGEKKYADAVIAEVLAVCRFPNWNNRHFLDTAEMSTSVAIGYDWLYELYTPPQRKEIRDALKKLAFEKGFECYNKKTSWTVGESNWNAVCNAGLTLIALAVAESDRDVAEKTLGLTLESIRHGIREYAPSGVYPEGPMYWAFGGSFLGLMIMALDDVFKDDAAAAPIIASMVASPGLDKTGDYYMNVTGPTGLWFNYADSGYNGVATPLMYALARLYSRPDYATWQKQMLPRTNLIGGRENWERLAAFQAIWYVPNDDPNTFAKTPLAVKLEGLQDVVCMRTSWSDPNAAYVGFKAGDNQAGHGHLDIGTFIYDVNGERWASELGADLYSIPGYFSSAKRWNFLRTNSKGHNTLVIGDQLQNTKAVSKMIDFQTSADESSASCSMTDAYEGQVKSAIRTVTLKKDGTLIVEDQLEGVKEQIRWGVFTLATVQIDGKTAILSQNGKRVGMRVVSDSVQRFETVSTRPPTEAETQNAEFQMVAAFAEPKQDGRVGIKVIYTPL